MTEETSRLRLKKFLSAPKLK